MRIVRAIAGMLVATLGVALTGCGHHNPEVGRIASLYGYGDARVDLEPLVLVPGFLGSTLVDADSGDEIWGLFLAGEERSWDPEVQRRVALPMTGAPTLRQLRDSVEVEGPMENAQIEIAGQRITVNAYPGLLWGILRGLSGEEGSGEGPDERTLRASTRDAGRDSRSRIHAAAYDWRRDISEASIALDAAVRAAHAQKLALGFVGDGARVDILAHSMGTLVTRYFLRYGTQPLPDDGTPPVLDWRGTELVRRVILVAPPNNGSLEAFRDLTQGGSPEPPVPKYPAAVLATFVSLFQMMPGTRAGAVVYSDDGSVVDVWSPETWRRLRWGPFASGQDDVLANLLPGLDSPEARRRAAYHYLALCLARGRQLDEVLTVDAAPPPGTTIHLFVGDTVDTHARLEVDRSTGELVRHHREPGDGTVPRRSALGWIGRDRASPRLRARTPLHPESVHFVSGDHLSMVGSPGLLNDALYLVLEAPLVSGTRAPSR